MPTIKELLQKFKPQEITEAEILLAHLLKKERSFVIGHSEKTILRGTSQRFRRLIERKNRGEPLAYLLECQQFFGLDFIVNRHVLIPRPESEWLIIKAREILRNEPNIKTVIDVGTGSGCLIISLLKNLSPTRRRQITAYGIDISPAALAVAKRNAKRHNVSHIKFLHGNLLAPTSYQLQATSSPVLLLANLPYLTANDYRRAPPSVKKFEPKNALTAGLDGLKYYRRLIAQLTKIYGLTSICIWEIDPCHSQKLKKLVRQTFPKSRPSVHKDYGNLDRYLTATITP